MARLTEEQKAANKVASQERTQAYKARRKAYRAELEAAEKGADQLPEQVELEAARVGLDEASDARFRALREIDEQIARLHAHRVEVEAQHRVVLDGAKQRRAAAWSARTVAGKKLEAEVNARYPDMVNCLYASQWQRPEGV